MNGLYKAELIHSKRIWEVRSRVDNYRSINALAETVNGLYKAELIHSKRIWESTYTHDQDSAPVAS